MPQVEIRTHQVVEFRAQFPKLNRRPIHAGTRYAIVILLLMFSGCSDPTDFETPVDSMTLYSLDPTYRIKAIPKPAMGEMFQGFPVLGKLDITSTDDQRAILKAVSKGVAESDGTEAKCFFPRHGIRITRGAKTIDYLICFECYQLNAYVNDALAWHKLTARSPAEELDKHLLGAGIPQAEKLE